MKYPITPKMMATHTSKARKRMLYVPMSEQITIIGPKTGNGMMAMRAQERRTRGQVLFFDISHSFLGKSGLKA